MPLGPDIKMAHHLTASVGGVAKHLGWLQGLGLAKPMAFQEPQDLGHPGVHWLRTIDDGFDLLDQSWRDGHGFDLLAAVGPVLDCCLDCTAGMERLMFQTAVGAMEFLMHSLLLEACVESQKG